MRYHDSLMMWKKLLAQSLEDDSWQWDWTTLGTFANPDQVVRARIVAKRESVWAAQGLLSALEVVSLDLGMPIQIKSALKNGQRIKKGTVICEWSGPVRSMLALERGFINLAAYACGIASQTRALVDQVEKGWKKARLKGAVPRVTLTRKTLPGYRDIAVHAVISGGGHSHRVSLAGGALIKENHIAAAGGVEAAVRGVRAVAPHGLKIECEVRGMDELSEALAAHVDIVMLDNFAPKKAQKAIAWIRQSAPGTSIEISGGITEGNVADFLCEGIDVISVGSLTHSVRAADFSLLLEGT